MNNHPPLDKQQPRTRVYCEGIALAENLTVTLSSTDSHHLINVLKLKIGDVVALFNPSHGEWLGNITNNRKNACEVILTQQIKPSLAHNATGEAAKKAKAIHLFYAPLKNHANSVLLEKTTELGVTNITQVITHRTTNKPLDTTKIATKTKEASEQCGRISVPLVHSPISLKALLTGLNSQLLWLNEKQTGLSLPNGLLRGKTQHNVVLLIGPEGGFTREEQAMLNNHPLVTPCYLKGNILRAETAALAAVALAVYLE